jgi:hypothetical protein
VHFQFILLQFVTKPILCLSMSLFDFFYFLELLKRIIFHFLYNVTSVLFSSVKISQRSAKSDPHRLISPKQTSQICYFVDSTVAYCTHRIIPQKYSMKITSFYQSAQTLKNICRPESHEFQILLFDQSLQ